MAASAGVQRQPGKPLVIGGDATKSRNGRFDGQENSAMLIFMLAAAMTITMLIATVFGLHQEAERFRFDRKKDRLTPFGPQ